VAALRSGRRFIGTDLNPDAVRWSAQRLRQFGAGRQPDDLPPLGRPDLLELIGSQT
jgi:hypothetical protein